MLRAGPEITAPDVATPVWFLPHQKSTFFIDVLSIILHHTYTISDWIIRHPHDGNRLTGSSYQACSRDRSRSGHSRISGTVFSPKWYVQLCRPLVRAHTYIANKKPQKVIDPQEWKSFKLIAKDHLSHNTAL